MTAPFGATAQSLARSPLGIIALFIVLIYSFASLLLGLAADSLSEQLKTPFVYFLVSFPVLVLGIFAWLVAKYHRNLYGPSDFADQRMFLDLQVQLQTTQRRVDVLAEMSPGLAVTPLVPALPTEHEITSLKAQIPADSEDPQQGRWGGQREANDRIVTVGKVRPLKADPENYRIPLEVRSTNPQGRPLGGRVRFHLHDTFRPDIEEVTVREGVAKLVVIAYGAFTVGIEIEDGTKLEVNLADPDIDAPDDFKKS